MPQSVARRCGAEDDLTTSGVESSRHSHSEESGKSRNRVRKREKTRKDAKATHTIAADNIKGELSGTSVVEKEPSKKETETSATKKKKKKKKKSHSDESNGLTPEGSKRLTSEGDKGLTANSEDGNKEITGEKDKAVLTAEDPTGGEKKGVTKEKTKSKKHADSSAQKPNAEKDKSTSESKVPKPKASQKKGSTSNSQEPSSSDAVTVAAVSTNGRKRKHFSSVDTGEKSVAAQGKKQPLRVASQSAGLLIKQQSGINISLGQLSVSSWSSSDSEDRDPSVVMKSNNKRKRLAKRGEEKNGPTKVLKNSTSSGTSTKHTQNLCIPMILNPNLCAGSASRGEATGTGGKQAVASSNKQRQTPSSSGDSESEEEEEEEGTVLSCMEFLRIQCSSCACKTHTALQGKNLLHW